MSDALIGEWREQAARAERWEPGRDPEPVLEALALSVALELTGDLSRVPTPERDRLRKTGQRALLHVRRDSEDEDEIEALRMCAAIARDGLRALSSRPLPDERAALGEARATIAITAPDMIVPGDVVRLLHGQLDGFAAGSLAMRIRRSQQAMAELRALVRLDAPEEARIALAAADAGAVLDPMTGRTVGALAALGAEAVLFAGSPRRLAVYAEEPDPLRLVGPGLTTEDVREGYWIGRVEDGIDRIEATLHVGDRSERWVIALE